MLCSCLLCCLLVVVVVVVVGICFLITVEFGTVVVVVSPLFLTSKCFVWMVEIQEIGVCGGQTALFCRNSSTVLYRYSTYRNKKMSPRAGTSFCYVVKPEWGVENQHRTKKTKRSKQIEKVIGRRRHAMGTILSQNEGSCVAVQIQTFIKLNSKPGMMIMKNMY